MGSGNQDNNKGITKNFLGIELERLKRDNLYRSLRKISVNFDTGTMMVDGKRINVHLCSNDYLGLSQTNKVLRDAFLSLNHISQCSSRLIAGNFSEMADLEEKLAQHRCADASLVYPTGYMANLGVLSTIADSETLILSDQLNHASIIDGCRLSRAKIKVFHHNDPQHLQQLLEESKSINRKIVVIEGIFSMDGDIARLRQICSLAKQYDSIIIVDDAHGDFIFGCESSNLFSGIPAYLSVNKDIDIHTSSLSKALGGFGGYVAADELTREILINKSRQFIYTSALPQHLCLAALASIRLAQKGDLQKKLFENILFFGKRLRKIGLIHKKPDSQIIPIIIGSEKLTSEFSNHLLEDGVLLQAIRYPTVQKGSARLRVSITARHTRHQLKFALDLLESVGRKLDIV
ncbi:MAG TPA: pyridoxal phosphate-dependent aminotransferase family protein [Nitrososphaeraceae archaeon]|nr:pyridoxal phosphate-dependent aminotransferase family protein [Nitrososphaeraceae archaeon]